MVMDAQPSPQSVGREFVRQYYTLLNKAPDHLHRFYNNSSSFEHGSLDSNNREATLVVGQKQIHNKIQQLNFRDCHAKISQVDSQATLGNGVVVQVTGELSNDGQPMRRFTQTFVLAAQSPKKYYVHNDIFRYQDVYSDEEADEAVRSDVEEETEQPDSIVVDNTNANVLGHQQIYYPPNVMSTGPNILPNYVQPQQQLNGVHDEILKSVQTQNQLLQTSPTPSQPIVPQQQNQLPPQAVLPSIDPINIPIVPQQIIIAAEPEPIQSSLNMNEIESPILSESPIEMINEIPEQVELNIDENVAPPVSNEPKTYANLVKSGGTLSFASAMSSSPGYSSRPAMSPPPSNKYQSDQNRQDGMGRGPLEQRSSTNRTLRNNASGQNVLRQQDRQSYQRQSYNDEERRQSNSNSGQFGDNHQLFLGNLPHRATEEELKALFSKFGTVVDLRIHSKPTPKITGVRAPPNYGFITYEDPQSVQNCLSNMPLFFPENSADGQKLNVEEKKTKMRGPGETGGRIGGNNIGGNGGGPRTGGQSRGPPPQGSLNRGGSGQRGIGSGGGGNRGGSFNRSDRGSVSSGQRSGNGNVSTLGGGGGGNNNYGRR